MNNIIYGLTSLLCYSLIMELGKDLNLKQNFKFFTMHALSLIVMLVGSFVLYSSLKVYAICGCLSVMWGCFELLYHNKSKETATHMFVTLLLVWFFWAPCAAFIIFFNSYFKEYSERYIQNKPPT